MFGGKAIVQNTTRYAFLVLESFRPPNAKKYSRRSEFDALASKMAAGVK